MSQSKSLLETYGIPIEHLDFDYVKKCEKVKEVQRILEILRSGEEGFYPELTKCAEQRLRSLDPTNKMFRIEHPLVSNFNPKSAQVQREVEEFINEVRCQHDSAVAEVDLDPLLPPIRKMKERETTDNKTTNGKTSRIKSCDYDQWNKYDPDTECLKMDLHEELDREKLLMRKEEQEKKIVELIPDAQDILSQKLSDAEKNSLADRHRLKGNEYFRSNEYQSAICEYTKSLQFTATAAAFNNRAVAYLKMKKYLKAISDCDECLSIEPDNVKAMIRRADALNATGLGNDAYRQYSRALELDPENSIARKNMKNIPIRLEIEDVRPGTHPESAKLTQEVVSKPVVTDLENSNEQYDSELRQLIVPKKIVRSKLSQAMSDIKELRVAPKSKKSIKSQ